MTFLSVYCYSFVCLSSCLFQIWNEGPSSETNVLNEGSNISSKLFLLISIFFWMNVRKWMGTKLKYVIHLNICALSWYVLSVSRYFYENLIKLCWDFFPCKKIKDTLSQFLTGYVIISKKKKFKHRRKKNKPILVLFNFNSLHK